MSDTQVYSKGTAARPWLDRVARVLHYHPVRALATNRLASGCLIALLVFFTGVVFRLREAPGYRTPLIAASYDSLFDICRSSRADLSTSSVVLVYIDEDSMKELNHSLLESAPIMDRSYHAQLLERLRQDGAKSVTMDIVFSDRGPNTDSDEQFAKALKSNGRVVLGKDYNLAAETHTYERSSRSALQQVITDPYEPFSRAAAKLGLVLLHPDEDFLVRHHLYRFEEVPGSPAALSLATAELLGLSAERRKEAESKERWVYYYGPPETIPHVSYREVCQGTLPPGFFRDKIVFVGARPMTSAFREKRDELRNPYASNGEFLFMPAVEVHATQFLNLLRGDWLKRPSEDAEILLLLLSAALFGFGLLRFRPLPAAGLAVAGGLGVLLIARELFIHQHLWFCWLIIVVAQIPVALLCAFVFRSLEWLIQRRKLEEQRRRAWVRIREQAALLDKAHDAIIVHDLDWRAHYWNRSAEELYGWTFGEVQKMNLRSDLFNTDEPKLLEAFQKVLATGEWLGEMKHKARDGKPLIVQSRWTLVRDEAGAPKAIFTINTDVTEQKSLEAQFLRTQRMESIGTLAGGIAHDLNNVLSPIVMGVELMKLKVSDEGSKKLLTTMASSAKRGSDMVKQVLTFARGQTGERAILQLTHLVREMQKIAKETFPKTIEFEIDLENPAPIVADATQIHQIILNLCVNARDAMPDGGKITVAARNVTLTAAEAGRFHDAKPISYVRLSVTDTGTGIPPEIIDKIFEPFFTTKEIGKGTGLGLSTVISIIKSHQGFLDLQSQVGKGTSFNVYLPAADAPVAPPSAPTPMEQLWGKGEMVLLVDDEVAVLDVTKSILTHYGYKVVTAVHGADALALYNQYKDQIKIILMDLMMPVMDGATAIRKLREQSSAIRFLAISGLMQSDQLKERLGGIEVPFLPKPFTTEKLLENLRRLITSPAVAPAAS